MTANVEGHSHAAFSCCATEMVCMRPLEWLYV